MYVITRRVTLRSVEEAAKKAEAGLVPILKRNTGFRGYHILDAGEGVGMSIAVFESREAAERTRAEALAWIDKNLAALYLDEPLMTTGDVILSVQPDEPADRAASAAAGSEAVIH